MRKIATVALVATLFIGCGGSNVAIPSQNTKPAWAKQVHADTMMTYFALGEGRSMDDAKNSALSSIASRISVSIDATFTKNKTLNKRAGQSNISETLKQDIVSKAKNIQFTNVQILKQFNHRGKWTVLVSVDREQLFQSQLDELKKIDSDVNVYMKEYKKASPFKKLMLQKTIKSFFEKAEKLFPLIDAMKPQYNYLGYEKKYQLYAYDFREANNALVIKLESDELSKPLHKIISEKLTALSIKLSKTAYNVTIKVSTTAKKRMFKSTNARLAKTIFAIRTTVIKAINKQGEEISNSVIKTKAGSLISYEDALSQVKPYEKLINKNGIIDFITSK